MTCLVLLMFCELSIPPQTVCFAVTKARMSICALADVVAAHHTLGEGHPLQMQVFPEEFLSFVPLAHSS